ncbi:MAG: transcription antitermination factor NusB [Candidatus Omnitrophica bacterium]|nr:transcription antitermination factor NusB [Candidatus Omnitrophota bacterium]
MKKRTQAREFALQILYQMDICRQDHQAAIDNFWQMRLKEETEKEIMDFSSQLVQGVAENLEKIDKKISEYATNWRLERMAYVDRNILRLGSYELLFREDIPPKVSINEAVELAKKFSSQEASKFVNGILDKIKSEHKK